MTADPREPLTEDPREPIAEDPREPMSSKRRLRLATTVAALAVIAWLGLTAVLGAVALTPRTCNSCHSMKLYREAESEGHLALTCRECHPAQGPFSVMGEGFGLQRWAVAELSGTKPRAMAFDDAPCRACHADDLLATSVRNGIRVRHVELTDRPCLDCHGGTGHALQGRLYGTALMEECTECHAASATAPETCDLCHEPGSTRGNERLTTWRATHGPNWKQTHGMGELRTCVSCHEPERCASCHGVSLPHPPGWNRLHGHGLAEEARTACATCHDTKWCSDCHGGTQMPHVDAYIMKHQVDAKEQPESCRLCHVAESCDACHRLAAHPEVDGVQGHAIEGVSGR